MATSCIYSQDDPKPETVFVTKPYEGKPVKPFPLFGQLSISIPVRATPERSESDTYDDTNTVFDYILPDGLSAHFGYGIHHNNWVGLSADVGIDYIISEKLVTAPIYGSLFFSPKIWENTNIYLQAGYGKAFALGRGDLSGTYQKYRFGLIFDEHITLYIEGNYYGFPLHEMKEAGSINFGVSFFNFL